MKESMQERFADIIVDITSVSLDRTFQYRIPENMEQTVAPGCVVQVPFGKGDRLIRGYVISISSRPQIDAGRLKEIQSVITEGLDEEARLVALAARIRERYGSTMAQALRTVFPIRRKVRRKEEKTILLTADEAAAREALEACVAKHQRARARLLEALLQEPSLPARLVRDKLNISAGTIRYLEEQKLIRTETMEAWRNPAAGQQGIQSSSFALTEQQQSVCDIICREMDRARTASAGSPRTAHEMDRARTADEMTRAEGFLIHGVTGSGKTEVYMELIAHAQQQGKAAIMLIPEISLTWQTVMRFRKRFGDRVSFIHSRLSEGERYDQYERVRRGEIDVMIGPRSALFMPFSNLGIIVIDEEQEGAYQSESVPRYHAREAARMRAEMEHAILVLGSATPSLEAYYAAKTGKYRLLELPERVNKKALPAASIVDMRKELQHGNRSIFSEKMQEAIEERLDRHEQVMLFLNRRGFAGFLSCRSCGHVIKCPHCDVALSLHQNGKMMCHYCGYTQPQTEVCPSCGSGFLRAFRAGTQQIEAETRAMFPDAAVLRMDLDTTQKKDAYDRILSAFAGHEADILVGTQMIVKGHDFPDVTLVGILAADQSLFVPDYRSCEKTFQLITQAAGRAGRAQRPGEVIVQTYAPEHYCIQAAAAQNYLQFYEQEIAFRKACGYPPAGHLLAVHLSGPDPQQLSLAAEYLGKFVCRCAAGNDTFQMLGPTDEVISRIQDQYRKVLYLKSPELAVLEKLRNHMDAYMAVNEGYRGISVIYGD